VTANQFIKKKTGSFTVRLAEQFADSSLQDALVDGLHSLANTYSLTKIPASKFADVYKFSCDSERFYFKQYHYRSPWDVIKHIFRPSRVKRTFKAAAMLDASGFASPIIVAMGYRRKGLFCSEHSLLTREIENASSIYAFFQQSFSASGPLLMKRDFIMALGRFVGRLHSKNISHGDLRLGNVLFRQNGPAWDFFLLDNERTVQYCRLPSRLRLKNLVQVNMFNPPSITHTDRLRFFRAYLSENPALSAVWKTWAAKVNRKTLWRLAKRRK
jgi:hypothetical protein